MSNNFLEKDSFSRPYCKIASSYFFVRCALQNKADFSLCPILVLITPPFLNIIFESIFQNQTPGPFYDTNPRNRCPKINPRD